VVPIVAMVAGRTLPHSADEELTDYVATRWYLVAAPHCDCNH
jgi:hypothetical protein